MKTIKKIGYFPTFILTSFGFLLLLLFAGEDNSKSNPPDDKCKVYEVTGPDEVCVNKSAEFCAVTNGDGEKVEWTVEEGNPDTGNGLTVTTSWKKPGKYTVEAECSDSESSEGGASKEIQVVELQDIKFLRAGKDITVAVPNESLSLKIVSVPANRDVTWSISGADLGCKISGSTLSIGPNTGTITIVAKDKKLCGDSSGSTSSADESEGDTSSESDSSEDGCCKVEKKLVIAGPGEIEVDVTFSGLNPSSVKEEEEGSPHETDPHGGFICFNDNDDVKKDGEETAADGQGNDIADHKDTNTDIEDPDLLQVSFTCPKEDGKLVLSWPAYTKVWRDKKKVKESTKKTYELLDQIDEINEHFVVTSGSGDNFITFEGYVEGIKLGNGSNIKISFTPSGGEAKDDSAKVYCLNTDLDGDSDNDSVNLTGTEDKEDETELKSDEPGLLIAVNNQDEDQDEIPDFADGFNFDGDKTKLVTNGKIKFVPIKLKFPDLPDLEKLDVTFEYSCNTPDENGIKVDTDEPKFYTLKDSNRFRLWLKDAPEERSAEEISSEKGDFIKTGVTYTADDFMKHAESSGGRVATIYVEAVNPSPKFGLDKIIVTVKAKADQAPAVKFECKDEINITAVNIDLDTEIDSFGGIGKYDYDKNHHDEGLENKKGSLIIVNKDDDNLDEKEDNTVTSVEDEDDFKPLKFLLSMEKDDLEKLTGKVTLKVTKGLDKISLYNSKAKNPDKLLLGTGVASSTSTVTSIEYSIPDQLEEIYKLKDEGIYIEGLKSSKAKKDIQIVLEFDLEKSISFKEIIDYTAIELTMKYARSINAKGNNFPLNILPNPAVIKTSSFAKEFAANYELESRSDGTLVSQLMDRDDIIWGVDNDTLADFLDDENEGLSVYVGGHAKEGIVEVACNLAGAESRYIKKKALVAPLLTVKTRLNVYNKGKANEEDIEYFIDVFNINNRNLYQTGIVLEGEKTDLKLLKTKTAVIDPDEGFKRGATEIFVEKPDAFLLGLEITIEGLEGTFKVTRRFEKSIKVDKVVPELPVGRAITSKTTVRAHDFLDGLWVFENVPDKYLFISNTDVFETDEISEFNSIPGHANFAFIEKYTSTIGEASVAIDVSSTGNQIKLFSENGQEYNYTPNKGLSNFMGSIITKNPGANTPTHEILHCGGIKHKNGNGREANVDTLFLQYTLPYIKDRDATNNQNGNNMMTYGRGHFYDDIDLMQAIHFRNSVKKMQEKQNN